MTEIPGPSRSSATIIARLGLAAAVLAALVSSTTPVDAATQDSAFGYVPPTSPTCRITSIDPTTGSMTFADTGEPTVGSPTFSADGAIGSPSESTTTVVLLPDPATVLVELPVREPCSGSLSDAELAYSLRNMNSPDQARHGTLTMQFAGNDANLQFLARPPVYVAWLTTDVSLAGEWTSLAASVGRRYDEFSYPEASGSLPVANTTRTWVRGIWPAVHFLLKTTLSTSSSRSTVAAGGSVTFRATLKKAADGRYVPAEGSRLIFQTRTGTGTWTSRKQWLFATSSGTVSYTFTPSKTMSWRFVHPGETVWRNTAPVTSMVRKITVS